MYATHPTIVIHSCAIHSMTRSKAKKDVTRKQSHVLNPIDLTLRSKVKVKSGY